MQVCQLLFKFRLLLIAPREIPTPGVTDLPPLRRFHDQLPLPPSHNPLPLQPLKVINDHQTTTPTARSPKKSNGGQKRSNTMTPELDLVTIRITHSCMFSAMTFMKIEVSTVCPYPAADLRTRIADECFARALRDRELPDEHFILDKAQQRIVCTSK